VSLLYEIVNHSDSKPFCPMHSFAMYQNVTLSWSTEKKNSKQYGMLLFSE